MIIIYSGLSAKQIATSFNASSVVRITNARYVINVTVRFPLFKKMNSAIIYSTHWGLMHKKGWSRVVALYEI
jgi:hypothetical protein